MAKTGDDGSAGIMRLPVWEVQRYFRDGMIAFEARLLDRC